MRADKFVVQLAVGEVATHSDLGPNPTRRRSAAAEISCRLRTAGPRSASLPGSHQRDALISGRQETRSPHAGGPPLRAAARDPAARQRPACPGSRYPSHSSIQLPDAGLAHQDAAGVQLVDRLRMVHAVSVTAANHREVVGVASDAGQEVADLQSGLTPSAEGLHGAQKRIARHLPTRHDGTEALRQGLAGVLPQHGLGSKRSTWLGPPCMKRWMTRRARGEKCGGRGARGFTAGSPGLWLRADSRARSPSRLRSDARARAPNPPPPRSRNSRRLGDGKPGENGLAEIMIPLPDSRGECWHVAFKTARYHP